MADKWPLANGNWSTAANWNGGTKPVAGDDVYADGKTVTIDENVSIASVRTTARTGGTAGGGFVLPPDITVTATVIGHINAHCLTRSAAGNPSYVIGNVQGSTTNGGFGSGVLNSSAGGVVFITGNVTGGTGGASGSLNSNAGIINSSSGGFVVTGEIIAGGNGGAGANIFGSGSFVHNGSFRNTSGTNERAIHISGSVIATLNSINSVANTTFCPMTILNTADVTITSLIENYSNVPVIEAASTATIRMIGNTIDGPNGCFAISGVRIWWGGGYTQRRSNIGSSLPGPLITYTSYANAGAPAVGNVRLGTVYGPFNQFTGTCAVPPAGSTAFGVPVDNTVGTAANTPESIRAALGLASANLDTQLAGIATDIDNITVDNAAIAEAVRVELTDELDIINNIPDSFDAISTQIDDIETVFYVSPAAFTSPGKITGRTLRPYYKDTSRLGPIGIADSTKTPIDLSAFEGDLYVSVMDSDTLEVLLYDNDPYFVTSNLYIDPSPESVGVLDAPLCWALRRISDNKTLMEGPWEVQFAAYRTTS